VVIARPCQIKNGGRPAGENQRDQHPLTGGPSTLAAKGKIEVDIERCKGCQLCFAVCPSKCIDEAEGLPTARDTDPARFTQNPVEGKKGCTGCAMCATICPEVAIEVYRAK
jgi:2-oxoglutarate ferredoxin oxidoreductase subunit delta